MSAELTDAQLVSRAKRGDLEAFEVLTTRHERRVYSLALRIFREEEVAQDLTQQTFLTALEDLSGCREDARFSTWLLRIVAHAVLQVLKARKRTEAETDTGCVRQPEYIAHWQQTPEELVERKEVRAFLDEALQQLNEKDRLIFLLRDVEGLSLVETAEALNISETNTKVRLLRARLQLQEILGEKSPGFVFARNSAVWRNLG